MFIERICFGNRFSLRHRTISTVTSQVGMRFKRCSVSPQFGDAYWLFCLVSSGWWKAQQASDGANAAAERCDKIYFLVVLQVVDQE
jgi:hypothetical protein